MRLGVVNGDLHVKSGTVIELEEGISTLTIKGTLYCSGDTRINGSLSALEIESESGDLVVDGNVNVDGSIIIQRASLYISGSLSAVSVSVDKKLMVSSNVTCERLSIGGKAFIGGDLSAIRIMVGGTLESVGKLASDVISVGGTLNVNSDLICTYITVGGRLKLNGKGKFKAKKVKIGGVIEATTDHILDIEQIRVGGKAKFFGGNITGTISVGGKLVSHGDLQFKELEVGGTAEIFGNCTGGSVDVGGSFIVQGSAEISDIDIGGILKVSQDLIVKGKVDVGGKIIVNGIVNAGNIDVGGGIDATNILVSGKVDVGGYIYTRKGTRAEQIHIGKKGKVKGTLTAKLIVAERRARLEDLYGVEIILDNSCDANNIYGKNIKIGRNCSIHGKILYTQKIDLDPSVKCKFNPEKVDNLPSDIT